ncbi:DUF4920 domain-containing protein [Aquimarina brevivitae]|uniref:Uncharacterized protein DUF4920 n=1 Tax=Aquimarina brevivitae TaxID=323412 RepID=A0A4Q7PJJ1_9FLAO|nr:DUF4920 domain-containing protein [Aquimarina brevivitae]RZT00219.1 uncharacterized protein DUF4920 [Aquimarina brevivitae]
MKKLGLFFTVLVLTIACQKNYDKTYVSLSKVKTENYAPFGESVTMDKIYSQDAIASTYQKLEEGDTLDIAFTSTVNDVCKAKGCWMKLGLNQEETMVKFKDYSFFVPKDIQGKEVIVQGKAFVTEMSVEDQKHFAKDGGQSEEEIAKITTPKKTYSFTADAVLVKNQ